MAADRESTFRIILEGDGASIKGVLAQFRSDVTSTVKEIERTTKSLELFGTIQADVKKASDAFFKAQEAASQFRQEIARIEGAGGKVGKELTANLAAAEKAAAQASKEYARSATQLDKLDATLKKAGVDTSNLAAAQVRLAEATKLAAAAALEQSQKQQLGFKTLKDIQPELAKLRVAYLAIRDSGKLSFGELTALQTQYAAKVKEVTADVAGFGQSFSALRGHLLTAGIAFGVVLGAVKEFQKAANEVQQSLTRVGTVTDASKQEIEELGAGVRKLARDTGLDLTQGLETLYEVLRRGIPADNALELLAAAEDAAKASLTDFNTVALLGTTILNSFGGAVRDLPGIFEKLFQSTKAGGPTFKEFADTLGELAPIAKAARIPFDDLIAIMTALKKANPSADIGSLQRLFIKLADPEVIKRLEEVTGISGSLVEQLTALGRKSLDLNQLRDVFPDARSIKILAALTQNVDFLNASLVRLKSNTSGIKDAVAAFDELPQERIERFGAAMKDLSVTIGAALGPGTLFLQLLTGLANRFNDVTPAAKRADTQIAAFNISLAATPFGPLLSGLQLVIAAMRAAGINSSTFADAVTAATNAASDAAKGLSTSVASIQKTVKDQIDAANAAASAAQATLKGLAAAFKEQIAAAQTLSTQALAQIDAESKTRLAALDLENLSFGEKQRQQVAIQADAAAQRLKVLQDSQAAVLALFDKEAAALKTSADQSAEAQKKVDRDLIAARKAILAGFVDAYRAQVDSLLALQKGFADKVKELDQRRVDVNADVEGRIAALRAEGLGAYFVYQQKVTAIEELLSKSRQALLAKEPEIAEKFAQQAIQAISGIQGAVTEGNEVVVDSDQARIRAIGLFERAQVEVNKAIDAQKGLAQDGAKATTLALQTAKEKLAEVTTEFNKLNALFKEGLKAEVDADLTKFNAAIDKLQAAQADKAILLSVDADLTQIQNQITGIREGLKKGLIDGAAAGVVEVEAKLIKLANSVPQLNLPTDEAIGRANDLTAKIKAIGDIKPKVEIQSNAAEVQSDIDKLKQPTSSTHTIFVETVKLNAAGGLIGDGPQGFARGGGVFPRMGGWKVPGTGDGDTVPAALPAGSFVIRKPAVRYYGDELMGAVARGVAAVRRFAGGGFVGPPRADGTNFGPAADRFAFRDTSSKEFFGDIRGAPGSISGASRDVGEIGPPTLPSDHGALVRLIMQYVADVGRSAIQDDMRFWSRDVDKMERFRKTWEQRPNDDALEILLQQARLIGLNLGITRGTHTGFDVDGRQYHEVFSPVNSEFGVAPGLFGLFKAFDFYRKGGQAGGTDTVPAMLTPGEFVVNRHAVGNVGTGLLHAINDMKISRDDLAGMFAPPQVRRFADGGIVAGAAAPRMAAGTAPVSHTTNVNMNVSVADILSEANIRRYVVPQIDKIHRRSK